MSDVAIRVDGISKRYRVYRRRRQTTIRAAVGRLASAPFRFLRGGESHPADDNMPEELWALRDISFEVARGDIVGIIGHNGAGKSTLLKVLARITEPTRGSIDVYGRVGCLLEVGTGFHPELSGRENTYLNGAILGMSRAEIARSLDEIIAFAEVEQFVDTPVKYYSSGMYLRLAFSVAAHLRPEILIVDEVLAVGDAQFQRKCLGKMQDVSHEGRTVLFVSHNLAAVRNICVNAVSLQRGSVMDMGEVNGVVDRYLARVSRPDTDHTGVGQALRLFSIERIDVRGVDSPIIKTFDDVVIRLSLRARQSMRQASVYLSILTLDQERLIGFESKNLMESPSVEAGELLDLEFLLEELPLLGGNYRIELKLHNLDVPTSDLVPLAYSFEVAESPVYGSQKLDRWAGAVGVRTKVRAIRHQTEGAEPAELAR